ncbi:multicopper oxidase family protein [Melittangium boletus]|nr:multicopper oxidase domain-containing protein [Melittangium boletus]
MHGPHGVRRCEQDVFVALMVEYALNQIRRLHPDGTTAGWDTVKLRSYNGRLLGPTIEARPGDTLNIMLHNMLPPDPNPAPPPGMPNRPHGFNLTNLHFHGMHVSPSGNADNMMVEVGPGQMFEYEVKIPIDHPAGTYWYHAHKHGSITLQLGSGLSGALIVRGDIDRVEGIREAREEILVLHQIPYDLKDDPTQPGQKANMVEDYTQFNPGNWVRLQRHFTINGEVVPTFELRPGEVQRWRFIHAGVNEGVRLRLVRRQGSTEVPLPHFQIAHDGITSGRLEQVDETELHPAYREDVMVRASDAAGRPLSPGTYWLVDELAATPATHVLARVEVKGPPVHMRLPRESDLARLAPFKPIEDHEITGQQQSVFSVLNTQPPQFLINGKAFDPNAPPRQLPLGAVEEWTVSSLNLDHPFHIHVNPFQLTVDGKLVWRDTLMVRQGETVKLRTRYERYIGMFMAHCHILAHEDLGMAEMMEIVMPGADSGHGGHHH